MRNIVTIILICILSFPAFGQEIENSHKDKTYKNIYLELLGASNMIGVSYDTRIKPGSAFGYRAGISYFYGTDYNSNEGHGFSVPLEFNCILGKRRSKFEAGTGINMGLYSINRTGYSDSWITEYFRILYLFKYRIPLSTGKWFYVPCRCQSFIQFWRQIRIA